MKSAVGELSLTPATVARALGGVAALLIVASVGGLIMRFAFGHDSVKGLGPLFDLDKEQNIPNYFSVLLMHVAALLLAGLAISAKAVGSSRGMKWALLSVGFLMMGYDEAFQVHESLVLPMQRMLGGQNLGILYFAWVVPGIAIVVALLLYFRRFLWTLPTATRERFGLAALLYLGGAIGMELLGGRYAEMHSLDNWRYNALATAEEALELAGMICFIWALMRHHAEYGAEVRVRFRHVPAGPALEQRADASGAVFPRFDPM